MASQNDIHIRLVEPQKGIFGFRNCLTKCVLENKLLTQNCWSWYNFSQEKIPHPLIPVIASTYSGKYAVPGVFLGHPALPVQMNYHDNIVRIWLIISIITLHFFYNDEYININIQEHTQHSDGWKHYRNIQKKKYEDRNTNVNTNFTLAYVCIRIQLCMISHVDYCISKKKNASEYMTADINRLQFYRYK